MQQKTKTSPTEVAEFIQIRETAISPFPAPLVRKAYSSVNSMEVDLEAPLTGGN